MLAVILIALALLGCGALAARHLIAAAVQDADLVRTIRSHDEKLWRHHHEQQLEELERLRPLPARVAELEAELAPYQAAPDLDPATAAALLQEVELPPLYPGMATTKVRVFDQQKCQHCGGLHSRACPRVRRIVFGREDTRPTEVEFWPDGRWPELDVLWLEDVMEAAQAGEVSGEG